MRKIAILLALTLAGCAQSPDWASYPTGYIFADFEEAEREQLDYPGTTFITRVADGFCLQNEKQRGSGRTC